MRSTLRLPVIVSCAVLIVLGDNSATGKNIDYKDSYENYDNDGNWFANWFGGPNKTTDDYNLEDVDYDPNTGADVYHDTVDNNVTDRSGNTADTNAGTKQENKFDFKELLKSRFVSEAVARVKSKIANFTDRVKINLQTYRSEAMSGLSDDIRAKLNETVSKLIASLELDERCLAGFAQIFEAIKSGHLWPYKFIDSMDLLPTGFLDGVLSNLGEYDQCLDIVGEAPNTGEAIHGQYCLAKVQLHKLAPVFDDQHHRRANGSEEAHENAIMKRFFEESKITNNLLKVMRASSLLHGNYYRMGVCLPSVCSGHQIERAINNLLSPVKKSLVKIDNCVVKTNRIFLNAYQITAIIAFLILVILVVVSTACELFSAKFRKLNSENETVMSRIARPFSLIANTRSLFAKPNSQTGDRLRSIDGLLLLFVFNDYFGRSYLLPVMHGLIGVKRGNTGLARLYSTDRQFFWLRQTSMPTIAIAFLSAVVLGYSLSKYRVIGNGRANAVAYVRYVLGRWVCFTRRIIGPILLIYLVPLFGSGPLWSYYEQIYAKPCKTNLFDTLFYYNNYAKGLDKICNLPSATLSAIFQLEIIAPILLILMKFKLVGLIFVGSALVIGCVASVAPKIFLGLRIAPFEVSKINSDPELRYSMVHYIFGTNHIIVVFIIGLTVGSLIRHRPKLRLAGGKITENILWIASPVFLVIATVWGENFKDFDLEYSQFNLVMWFSLKNILFSLAMAWIVFACCTKRGGYLNRLLCADVWHPWTRLSIGIYLNQTIILSYRLLTKRDTYILSQINIIHDYIGDFVLSAVLAYAFAVLIECPVYELTRKAFEPVANLQTNDSNKNDASSIEDDYHLKNKNLSESVELRLMNDESNKS